MKKTVYSQCILIKAISFASLQELKDTNQYYGKLSRNNQYFLP